MQRICTYGKSQNRNGMYAKHNKRMAASSNSNVNASTSNTEVRIIGRRHSVLMYLCYTEKASPTRHRPERQHNARSNRRKQCSPNETKPYSKPTLPRKRQTTPTNGDTPRRLKPTHTRLTYTRMRPHAPSHQAGDHPVPAHTERHNPPRLRTQRQGALVCAFSV